MQKAIRYLNVLGSHKVIFEKELKYFTYNFEKATTNLWKYKCLSGVPGRPVISKCGMPTEKVADYLDYILKPIMQDSWS